MEKKFIFLMTIIFILLAIGLVFNTPEKKDIKVSAVYSKYSHALTPMDMLEDFTTMWEIIEENYPYMGLAKRSTGKNFETVKAAYYAKLEEVRSDQEFCDLISECLGEFEGCGHIGIFNDPSLYSSNLASYKEAGEYSKHCKEIYNTLNNEASKAYYCYKEKEQNANQMDVHVASSGVVNFTTLEFEQLETAYIQIPGFEDSRTNVPALIQYFKSITDYKYCIIDIRGNGGGSTSYWSSGIVGPNLKRAVSYTNYILVKGDKSADYVSIEDKLFPISKLDLSSIPNVNQEDFAEMDYYCKNTLQSDKASEPIFRGEFFVLTDGRNYSSAEAFAVFCKETGFAILIGETTGGDGNGYDPMISVLPKSGICFRFSALYVLNSDGGSNEEYGTKPDIACKREDALKVCLDYIMDTN
jgi:hypothetical protein